MTCERSTQKKCRDPRTYGRRINRLAYLVLAALVFAVLPSAVAAGTGQPTIGVKEFQVTPSVLLPGEEGIVRVVLQNTASSASYTETSVENGVDGSVTTTETRDISARFESVRLFGNGVDVVEGTYDHAGALGPGQTMPLTFLIKAPRTSGMYFPEVWISLQDGGGIRYPIPVNVNSAIGIQRDAILILSTALPDSVQPGDDIPVTLTVQNAGQVLAEDVRIQLERGSTTTLAPRGTDLYHLGTLNAGEQKSVDLVLASDKKSPLGLTRIPVTLQYTGVDGTAAIQNTSFDVRLVGQAELGFVSVDTNPRRVTEGQPFDLTIRIENTGTGEAKQVSATVDLPMGGTKEAFIGKIKPGNDAPAIFILDGGKSGTYPYTVTITYTDDTGTHTVTRDLSLRVFPAGGPGVLLPLGLILVLGGFVGYRYVYLPRKNGSGEKPWLKKS